MLPLDKLRFFETTHADGQRIIGGVFHLEVHAPVPPVTDASFELEVRKQIATQFWRMAYVDLMQDLQLVGQHLHRTTTERDLAIHQFRSVWMHLHPDFTSLVKTTPIEKAPTQINGYETIN